MGVLYNPKIVTSNLVLCLDAINPKSYPGSGNTWIDLSGNERNGTLFGTTSFSNNAIDLGSANNTTNYIKVPNSVMTNLSTYTLSFWVNPSNLNGLNTIWHATNSGSNYYSIEWYPTYIQTLNSSTYSTFFYTFSNDAWYNIVFHRTGTTIGCYLNGVSLGSNTCPSTTFTVTGAIVLGQEQDAVEGGFQATQCYRGKYAAVSLYNRELTADEISQNFNALRGRYGI